MDDLEARVTDLECALAALLSRGNPSVSINDRIQHDAALHRWIDRFHGRYVFGPQIPSLTPADDPRGLMGAQIL